MGQPYEKLPWMEGSLLSDHRRILQDFHRIDGKHRVGQIRHRQRPPLQQLYGTLRLRTNSCPGDRKKPK